MALSPGTLSLRFMRQQARLPRAEPAQQARVKDDAEWELPADIRQAWAPMAYRGEKAVTYETSYLPFLFPSLRDTPTAHPGPSLSPPGTPRPRGRRVFGKRGEEIAQQASPSTTDTAPREHTDDPAKQTRPLSISFTAKPSKRPAKDPARSARDAVFDTSSVGADLGHRAAFIRPAGVDGPADPPKTAETARGAGDVPEPRVKRSRTSGDPDEPRKKTRLALIE